jgi:hypothetical protein
MVHLLIVFCLILAACQPTCQQRQQRATSKAQALLRELKSIERRDQLIQAQERVSNLYASLAEELMIAEQSYPDHLSAPTSPLSAQLRAELQRLYAMEGGREILETAQEPALKILSVL